MIAELLTKKQKEQIAEVIKERCFKFQQFERYYSDLFYEPYTRMRHKHTLTSAVLSGFAPGTFHIEGISSTDLNYGANDNMVQPELDCANGKFHIYSDGSDLKGKKIMENCSAMNEDITTVPLFFVIIFTADVEKGLSKIEMRLFDKNGMTVEREIIYERPSIIALAV